MTYQDQRLDSNRIDFNIATEIQQKANMTLISQKQCKEMWGDSIGSLTDGQGSLSSIFPENFHSHFPSLCLQLRSEHL